MKVVVISSKDILSVVFNYLRPGVEIEAIIIVEAPLMKKYPMDYNNKVYYLYSYDYLQECLNELKYDYILFNLIPWGGGERIALEDIRELGKEEKLFHIGGIAGGYFDLFPMFFNYITPRIKKYRIVVIGDSTAWRGTDLNSYKLPAVNIAFTSQDLYYDYLLVKKLIGIKKSAFKYGIIAITPWIFNSDISIGSEEDFMILCYYRLFKDTHHFRINGEEMKKIFIPSVFNYDNVIPQKNFNLDLFSGRYREETISLPARMSTNKRFSVWEHKSYPETVKENIEILKKILDLFREKNITPILVRYPLPDFFREFFPKRVLAEGNSIISDLGSEYNFHYLDKSDLEGLTYDDFLDGYHVNAFGARKISAYLNDYIMKLEEHN